MLIKGPATISFKQSDRGSVLLFQDCASFKQLLEEGVCQSSYKAVDKWRRSSREDAITIIESPQQALTLLSENPAWKTRLKGRYVGSDDFVNDPVAEITAPGAGLALATMEQINSRLKAMLEEGLLEERGEAFKLAKGKSPLLLEGRSADGRDLSLLLFSGSFSMVNLKSSEPRLEQMASVAQLQAKVESLADCSKPIRVIPAEGPLPLLPLGAIGELLSWRAYVAGCQEEAKQEDINLHPPGDWLAAGGAAICREASQVDMGDAALRCSVQLQNSGSMITAQSQPQPHRLQQAMPALHLYRPANPYHLAPEPMSRR